MDLGKSVLEFMSFLKKIRSHYKMLTFPEPKNLKKPNTQLKLGQIWQMPKTLKWRRWGGGWSNGSKIKSSLLFLWS